MAYDTGSKLHRYQSFERIKALRQLGYVQKDVYYCSSNSFSADKVEINASFY